MAEQVINYIEAMNQAIKEEMRRDERVVLWGIDLISCQQAMGTQGIFEEFGGDRILDTPIVEEAIVAMAAGAAFAGLRPVAFLGFASFVPLTCDALFMKLGCNYQEWRHGGQLPVVIMAPFTIGAGIGADHTTPTEAILIHSPGLKVVVPSTPYDAKGLLKSAIRDESPVVFMPHSALYSSVQEAIPTEEYLVPLGKADVKRQGQDITIVTYSAMAQKALAAAEKLSKEGIDVEVVDLRCLVPLDVDTIVRSVAKTGRLLVAHEAAKRGGVAAEIISRFIEAAPDLVKTLKTPIKRLAAPNIALPPQAYLEDQIIPQVDDVVTTIREMV